MIIILCDQFFHLPDRILSSTRHMHGDTGSPPIPRFLSHHKDHKNTDHAGNVPAGSNLLPWKESVPYPLHAFLLSTHFPHQGDPDGGKHRGADKML